ncbi:uncharacterized protein BT62DRAFT_605318 [Guyanagaster necrorhizus]|uniref:Uncharacterized protein n=1 Tax=Guyanagaster necrorhizus TaxID=856835 RepID=A0A9P7W033_9AGAR|nr:uncharacterized protein BT62DRAFT_605318 [Guyanagaster necrorhizus MCA 3950]KAG7449753.1 hypothetical protein BT62DRAFT_605318 [Guyanagaster necrorhizus MCA 3950]
MFHLAMASFWLLLIIQDIVAFIYDMESLTHVTLYCGMYYLPSKKYSEADH